MSLGDVGYGGVRFQVPRVSPLKDSFAFVLPASACPPAVCCLVPVRAACCALCSQAWFGAVSRGYLAASAFRSSLLVYGKLESVMHNFGECCFLVWHLQSFMSK